MELEQFIEDEQKQNGFCADLTILLCEFIFMFIVLYIYIYIFIIQNHYYVKNRIWEISVTNKTALK